MRDALNEMLRQGDAAGVAALVAGNPRAVRRLRPRLWDADAVVRDAAARAFGELAAMAPRRGQELMRQFIWGLNEESGTNGAAAVPALKEMARRAPDAAEPHVGAIVALLKDAGLRPGLIEVLSAVAEVRPMLLAQYVPDLRELAGEAARPIIAAVAEAREE